jgi:16S rRNA (uracil1498-N3)-methyltransferase
MPHFFGKLVNGEVTLSEEDTFHLLRVLRLKEKDEISLIVIGGRDGFYEITSTNPLKLTFIRPLVNNGENEVFIRLYYCLSKGTKPDLVIEKATELGVNEIVLLHSSRVVVNLDEVAMNNRLERYRRIAISASKQCKRSIVPKISGVYELSNELLSEDKSDLKLIAYEEEKCDNKWIFNLLDKEKVKSIALLVGPEGGFSKEEVSLANANNFVSISLGKRILRSETAAIHLVGLVSAILE